jgi:cellulose synthase/poly-beta-1,6-N-acetylglucosamine synthase-like glycosyltransferase
MLGSLVTGDARIIGFEQQFFLFALSLMVYVWAGYPIILGLLGRLVARPRPTGPAGQPLVSVIVAAHDEETRMRAKLENCQCFDYPPEKIEIIVSSDGSTDQTEAIVEEFAALDPRIRLFRSGRVGKSAVQNVAVQHARGEVLFFTDANARVNADALQFVVADFADPRVGLVSAEAHFDSPGDAVSRGQGFYWRFELFLRRAESDLGILATTSGQAFAVRRELFQPLPIYWCDDCITPLDVRLQGYRVLHDPRAIVFDTMPHSIQGELGARIRMTAHNWGGTLARSAILNPWRFPLTALGLVSHKLLRWLTPFLLAIIFLANTALALQGRALLPWILQIAFYLSAYVGWRHTRKKRPAGVFGYPFSFCLANVGFFLGMVKVMRGQRIVAYQSTD